MSRRNYFLTLLLLAKIPARFEVDDDAGYKKIF
jgi:hypothetical protein